MRIRTRMHARTRVARTSGPTQEQCWHVYLPLTVGHGYNYCNASHVDCTDGYNVTVEPCPSLLLKTFPNQLECVFCDPKYGMLAVSTLGLHCGACNKF